MATKSGYVHPEWLDEKFMERALREGEADPDIVVKHIQVKAATAVGDNYVGLMYRVYVEFVGKGGSRDKQSFIVKALPVEQTARKLIIETNLFSTESTMYKKTIPDMERLLQGSNPERYRPFSPKGIYLAPRPDETLVLEDLSVSGFKMAERLQGLDLDHSKLAFQRLAMFHAASVALAEKDPSSMVCYETDVYSENILLKSFFTNAIKSTIEEVNTWPGYSEKYSHKLLKLSETLFENVIENRKRISGDLNVLNHGDAWLNNMMFKYSETGEVIDHRFVDYQLAYYGSPVIDLHYMLSTTPSPQYGLFDITDVKTDGLGAADDSDDDGDDGDLEAELAALTSGKSPTKPKRVKPSVPAVDLDAMVAQSMKDIPSDEELSGDDDDPDLLAELGELAEDEEPIESAAPKPASVPHYEPTSGKGSLETVLEERLKMYQEAEKNAKLAGESTRARRFGRGIKTLADQLRAAKAGRVVNEEDIPPPVAISAGNKPPAPAPAPATPARTDVSDEPSGGTVTPSRAAPPPPVPARPAPLPDPPKELSEPPASPPPSIVVEPQLLSALTTRRDQYKLAALQAKRAGDGNTALQHIRTAKQFEAVINGLKTGQPVDLSQMPPPPPGFESSAGPTVVQPDKEEEHIQNSSDPPEQPQPTEEEQQELYKAPPPPSTVLEALEQRLAKYRSTEQAAKDEGNSGKARRLGRIVKQYETAIKQHRAGKPIAVEELPTPPGFGPIPMEGSAAPVAKQVKPAPAPPSPLPPKPVPESPTPSSPSSGETIPQGLPSTTPQKLNVRKSTKSRQEKQMAFLEARQKEFKLAALQAKQKGEINQAKEYLRLAKGFDPLIEASIGGLPVDMATERKHFRGDLTTFALKGSRKPFRKKPLSVDSTRIQLRNSLFIGRPGQHESDVLYHSATEVPIPPNTRVVLETDFDFVSVDDCTPGSDGEIFEKLEEDLLKQAKMCLTNRDHFKAVGDVASTNRFEQLALHSKKDLDAVRVAHKRGEAVPKFHYETKVFSIVQCCTDLGDNDLELTIIQGINYTVPNPKDVDTYVKFEFPYPTEDPPKDRTSVVKDTNNPEYNQVFPLTFQRNVRACQRVFKRHSIKLEVWSKGGFFRGDTLIGTANVKLQPLESKCIIHDSFDLVNGRKPIGGKLEVKVRIRNPIVVKQVEQVTEKWLVIDHF
uniref:C2 domain-containing protein n=1 Tax=Timema poppense TaxID=170557 RepID=A0A7R9H0I1_TIMPO|nr:unnamed protein product [Timema poppensis]